MTTLSIYLETRIAPSVSYGNNGKQAANVTVQAAPRDEVDMEERRWQLEWERRNVED